MERIVVGASSIQFILDSDRAILLDYYGAVEDQMDWLYRLPLCGNDSVQRLVGQTIDEVIFDSPNRAKIVFSEGKVLRIIHDDVSADLMRFVLGDEEYIV